MFNLTIMEITKEIIDLKCILNFEKGFNVNLIQLRIDRLKFLINLELQSLQNLFNLKCCK